MVNWICLLENLRSIGSLFHKGGRFPNNHQAVIRPKKKAYV